MKNKFLIQLFIISTILVGMLVGCKPAPSTDVLYVNITWHQHQPLYYKDANGVYSRPWVRVHATKDYLDMAQTVAAYPEVRATFNLTPSLIRQLDDFASNGVKDLYWVLAEIPAAELTESDKRFILERFFDANWDHIIAIYPRYQELLDKRAGTDAEAIEAAISSFTEQDFRDLQIWFNLAWIDPDFLAVDPLKSLVEKGENFSEEDKVVLFDEILKLIQQVIPYHADLQKEGNIEVTTTPYAHPILPLIYNSDLALVGNPSAETPDKPFSYPQDAEYHLEKSVEMYKQYFDQKVRGLWPGEGSVAQDVVGLIADAGYTYMQTGEPVLAKSLGIDSFTRDSSELVNEADQLYRPYYVQDNEENKVAIFFRDWNLSDKIGFTYSGMQGKDAAEDLVTRLEAIQAKFIADGTQGPHIVSLILDGENAWENYDNDGKEFLNTLYQLLSQSEVLKTVTPSEYLKFFPEQQTIENLFPGAWFSPNYDTWYGENEEAIAWNYLNTVREFLSEYERGEKQADPQALAEAFDTMYLAEGSDWFWWYGADQDSGQDGYFDEGYRELLKGVYIALGEEVPSFLNVPIIQPQAVRATSPMMSSGTPEVDGEGDDEAWEMAAFYEGSKEGLVKAFYYVLDDDNLYFRLDTNQPLSANQKAEVYLAVPNQGSRNSFASDQQTMLTMAASSMLSIDPSASNLEIYTTDGASWELSESEAGTVAQQEKIIEASLPLEKLGSLKSGDEIKLTLIITPDAVAFPDAGPAAIQILDLGEATSLLLLEDPLGDDNGPGTYTYPTNSIFADGVFDIKSFEISYDAASIIFTLGVEGAIENGWGSPNGFSVQTFDVYIDKDPGQATGARLLLPGRNAALAAENGWEYSIWVEGWTPQVVIPDSETLEPKDYSEASSAMKIFVDPGKNAIIVRVPLVFLGEGDPSTWGYAVTLLGQEGYPATGVWRVRDVVQEAAEYRFGGAPLDNNHTRIIDIVWPSDDLISQADILGGYPTSAQPVDLLTADDFAIIPLLLISE